MELIRRKDGSIVNISKISEVIVFIVQLFILDAVKLAVIQQQCCMKECDIFMGSKYTPTPPTYIQGVSTPNPQDLRPCNTFT